MEIVVQRYGLANPVWNPNNPAMPGQQVTLRVDAPDITPNQYIEFRIVAAAELVDVLRSDAGQRSAQWTVPNLPAANNVTFTAIRREKATPTNGHQTALATLVSPHLQVHGFTVQMAAMNAIDEAFVPSQENLQAVFTVTDAGGAAANGRYEIWGERYPGTTPAPLYTENFNPAPGNTTWNTWNGQANAGLLSGHFITPEFSPYRLRVWIGPTQAAVDDPRSAGLGLVACAEAEFEIKFTKVEIRLQNGVTDAAADQNYHLPNALGIEPLGNNGIYAAGGPNAAQPARLPAYTGPANFETMRLRIPVAMHQRKNDPLDQDEGAAPGYGIGTNYMDGGGKTKFDSDSKLYSRPEIPIEFVPKLASRNPGANPDGLVQADAVGPAIIEPLAEEYISQTVLAAAGGPTSNEQYWRNAAFKVKKGEHQHPVHDAATNGPVFHYWTARLQVLVHGARDFDIANGNASAAAFDNSLGYLAGQDELTVYLNRTLLTFSDRADDNDLDSGKFDYREVAGGPPSTQIRLRANLTKVGDILWIVREDSTAAGDDVVDKWKNFPPGPNCHLHYGGVRGEVPTAKLSNYFRASYSKQKSKRKAIVGLATASFPYKKYVKLKPDKAEQKKQERVEVAVMTAGAQQGMAGVLFSPSFIGGDSYTIWALLESEAYRRRFGFFDEEPPVRISDRPPVIAQREQAARDASRCRSGIVSVWRWARVKDSFRLPDIGTNGLAGGVGGDADGVRVYAGNGQNMTLIDGGVLALSTVFAPGFTDWSKIDPTNPPPGGGGNDATHASVNLATYRGAHNTATGGWNGAFNMAANTDIKNYSVAWDYYRAFLPPNLPALPNLITNAIEAQAAGTSSNAVGQAVAVAINGHGANPDVVLNPAPVTPSSARPIPPCAVSVDVYTSWFDGKWDEAQAAILDVLIPKVNKPDRVNVVRWPTLHEHDAWNDWDVPNSAADFNTMMTLGFSSGDAQSMFRTANYSNTTPRAAVAENTFPHEMGHSLNLVHFVAENFAWKHHDANNPDCLMSYTYTTGFILQPAGAVGAGATADTGFPQLVPPHAPPGAPFPSPASGATAANAGQNCIRFGRGLNPVNLCAKCVLKLRGWNDELLPFAWRHPDLF